MSGSSIVADASKYSRAADITSSTARSYGTLVCPKITSKSESLSAGASLPFEDGTFDCCELLALHSSIRPASFMFFTEPEQSKLSTNICKMTVKKRITERKEQKGLFHTKQAYDLTCPHRCAIHNSNDPNANL
jgi:hypothetical protein